MLTPIHRQMRRVRVLHLEPSPAHQQAALWVLLPPDDAATNPATSTVAHQMPRPHTQPAQHTMISLKNCPVPGHPPRTITKKGRTTTLTLRHSKVRGAMARTIPAASL